MESIAEWLVHFVREFGYLGIYIMTFLESTFVPFPAELTMIPAGYLVHQGVMNIVVVFGVSVIGAITGSIANYYIAYHYGRRFLYEYGKYLFFPHDKMEKLDAFFASHGEISTLTGRLVPGLRHFISFPAGLARMKLYKFCLYTFIGSGIWMGILITVGYLIGGNKTMVRHYMPYITGIAIGCCITMVILYIAHHRRQKGKEDNGND